MNDEDKIKADKEEQEFQKRLKSLPEDLQSAFTSSAVTEAIIDIGKKHNLMVDKIGRLGDETGSVMLGITPPKDYIKNLMAMLEIDKVKAKEIAEEVNQTVFQPVRESLKKVHGLTLSSSKSDLETLKELDLFPSGKLRPEIILPIANRIAIKSSREEMDNIDVSEEIPGMTVVEPNVFPQSKDVFAKKINVPMPHKSILMENKQASPLTFAPKPKLPSIDDMLSKAEESFSDGPRPTARQSDSNSATTTPFILSNQQFPRTNLSGAGKIEAEIEKTLGGEIRRGTVSPDVDQSLQLSKQRNDPYREPLE
jgi:hypothetical protein